jgi:hypothetical protein
MDDKQKTKWKFGAGLAAVAAAAAIVFWPGDADASEGEGEEPLPGPLPPTPTPSGPPKICSIDGLPYDSTMFRDDGQAVLSALRALGRNVPWSSSLNPKAWLDSANGRAEVEAFQRDAMIKGWGPLGKLPEGQRKANTDGKMGPCTLRSLAAALEATGRKL